MLVASVLTSPASFALGQCEMFESLKFSEGLENLTTIERRVDLALTRNLRDAEVASRLFDSFVEGRGSFMQFNACIRELPEPEKFLNSVQATFFAKSYRRFSGKTETLRTRKFFRMMSDISEQGRSFMFRLTGDRFDSAPTEEKAGFHRGSGSIFMDIDRISPDEWLVIFAHEMVHALDNLMYQSVSVSSNDAIVERLSALARSSNRLDMLSPADQRLAKTWVRAEMDRGLFAEYRAWYVTILIYQDGLKTGLWKKIPWFEAILQQKAASESMAQFIYRYLNARAYDVNEGMFSWPLLQDVRARLRVEFAHDGGLDRFGALSALVRP